MTKKTTNTPNAPDTSAKQALRLSEVLNQQAEPSKAALAFQKLLKQIENQREKLAGWVALHQRYRQEFSLEIKSLQEKFWFERRAIALCLEDAYLRPKEFPDQHLRETLLELLLDLVGGLLQERDDADLRALRERYRQKQDGLGHDEAENDLALAKQMLETMLDIKIDDDHGAKNLDELMLQAFTQKQAADQAQEEQAKNSPKERAALEKREQAAKEVSQSVRAVYRKLSSALHPDRASDAAEHTRRTELMQRVNIAYEAGDLLEMLKLQLEIEQIDAEHLANLSAERQAHYTLVLREQLAEIKEEIRQITAPFRMLSPIPSQITPRFVENHLRQERTQLEMDIASTQADLKRFSNIKAIIAFVKEEQMHREHEQQMIALRETLFASADFRAKTAKKSTPKAKSTQTKKSTKTTKGTKRST